jgi:thioredoxin-related protein
MMSNSSIFRRLRLSAAALFVTCFAAAPAAAAELVMFESRACEWCVRWHEEIGPIYPKTAEAQCAPLRQVDIHEPRPADLAAIGGLRYTPTFVVVEDGREIGRIVGYPGEDFFWALLDGELEKLAGGCPVS